LGELYLSLFIYVVYLAHPFVCVWNNIIHLNLISIIIFFY